MIVIAEERQPDINQLRIDLAQATIDMASVNVSDFYSRQTKERVIEGLRKVRDGLDSLGVMHSCARRCANGGA